MDGDALVDIARRPDATIVARDDRAADRQTHAEAVGLGAHEALEDALELIVLHADAPRHALQFLLKGVDDVFDKLEIDKTRLLEKREAIIEGICADATMLAAPSWDGRQSKTWTLFKAFFDNAGVREPKR